MNYSIQIPKPRTEQDFEIMCAHIYGKIYNSSLPTVYGRKGQKQHGLDILFQKNDQYDVDNRIAMQCKHVQKLTFDEKSGDTILKEVEKADKGSQQINLLIIATSLPSDKNLLDDVKALSDQRVKQGKFAVEMQFWDDISREVSSKPDLMHRYQAEDIFLKELFNKSKELLHKEKYNAILDLFSENNEFNKSFNLEDKFQLLILKAKCFNALDKNKEYKLTMTELDKFGWDSEEYHFLRISKLLKEDKERGESELCEVLKNNPDSLVYKRLKVFNVLIIKRENLFFENICNELKDDFNTKYYFLMHYNNTTQLDRFDEVYSRLTYDEQQRSSVCLCNLASRVNKYRITKAQADKQALSNTLNLFTPRSTKVWSIENPQVVKSLVELIFQALIYLEEFSAYIKLYDECLENQLSINENNLIDLLYVCNHVDKRNKFFEISRDNLDKLGKEKVWALERVINFGFHDYVENKIRDCPIEEQEHLLVLLWRKTLSNDDFIDIIKKKQAIEFSSPLALFNIANCLYDLHDQLFDVFNARIHELIASEKISDISNISLYLTHTKQYKQALNPLENICSAEDSDLFSSLLLEAYIRTKNFRKAKNLIEKILPSLKIRSKLLNLCYEMAKETHDWSVCNKLTHELEESNKDKAWLWTMKLTIAYQIQSKQEQLKIIRDIPELIEGEPEEICWIAYQEAINNSPLKARNRIKHLWRNNIDNLEAERAILKLFFGFLRTSNGKNPFFDEPISIVNSGVVVTYKTKNHEEKRIIDKDEASISPPNFITPSSKLGQALIGKKKGEKFNLEKTFGFSEHYEITDIKPLLLEVWHQLIEKSHRADNPYDFVAGFNISADKTEGITDFLEQISEISQKTHEKYKIGLDLYQAQPFTVKILAKFLGKNLIDMVYNWPLDYSYPSLSIDSQYINDCKDEIYFKDEFLSKKGYVVDCFTLMEMKFLNVFDVLNDLENINIPMDTYSHLKDLLRYIKEDGCNENLKGHLTNNGDRPIFVPHDPVDSVNISKHLEEIIYFIEKYCSLENAYGDESLSELDIAIHELLTKSESAILRLCREKKLPLVSFDARLRALAHQANIETVNMDDVVLSLLKKGNAFRDFFAINKFIKNRTIDSKYLDDKVIVQFSLSDNLKFHSFLQAYFGRLIDKTAKDAIEYYLMFINMFISQGVEITFGGLDHLNKIFFVYMLSANKNNLEDVRNLLLPHMPKAVIQFSSFSGHIDEINATSLNLLKILHGFNKPMIHASS
jgi:hypothetical protein